MVDLRSVRTVSTFGSGYCQDARSWIWMPRYVEYSVSVDGENFTPVGKVDNTVEEQDYTIQTRDFVLRLSEGQVREGLREELRNHPLVAPGSRRRGLHLHRRDLGRVEKLRRVFFLRPAAFILIGRYLYKISCLSFST